MISTNAVQSALPLTQILDARNFVIAPAPGTPLEALVQATRIDPSFNRVTDDGFEPDVDGIVYMANAKDEVLKASPHDRVMNEVTEVCIKAVQGHMIFARNVVAPAVAELAEKTQTALQQITASSLLGMNVVVWNPPAPAMTPGFAALVKKFAETPYDSPKLNQRLPNITVSEMVDLMATGSGSMDGAVREWAAGMGDSFFINVWENIFQTKQADLSESRPLTFQSFGDDKQFGLDNMLAVFLLARRLVEEPLENTEMSLASYTSAMADLRDQAGLRLSNAISQMEIADKGGLLIRNINDRIITVNGSVYKLWIEAGGDNEVLFGDIIDNTPVFTVAQINERADEFKKAWHKYAMMTLSIENSRRFQRTKQMLSKVFADQMRNPDPAEELNAEGAQRIINAFEEALEQLVIGDFDDLYTTCLKLVCRTRFPRTQAERILSGIERVKKENPTVDVREAAAVSVLEYVSYWVSTQMVVRPA